MTGCQVRKAIDRWIPCFRVFDVTRAEHVTFPVVPRCARALVACARREGIIVRKMNTLPIEKTCTELLVYRRSLIFSGSRERLPPCPRRWARLRPRNERLRD